MRRIKELPGAGLLAYAVLFLGLQAPAAAADGSRQPARVSVEDRGSEPQAAEAEVSAGLGLPSVLLAAGIFFAIGAAVSVRSALRDCRQAGGGPAVTVPESLAEDLRVPEIRMRSVRIDPPSSEESARMLPVFDDITFQTNLLALSVGLEAVAGGEARTRFASAVSEVGSLAEQGIKASHRLHVEQDAGSELAGARRDSDLAHQTRRLGQLRDSLRTTDSGVDQEQRPWSKLSPVTPAHTLEATRELAALARSLTAASGGESPQQTPLTPETVRLRNKSSERLRPDQDFR